MPAFLRMRLVAALCVLVYCVSGCTSVDWRRDEAYLAAAGLPIDGGTVRDRALTLAAVRELPEVMQEDIAAIHLTNDCPWYEKDKRGRWKESGHCHWDKTICIHPEYLEEWVVWHEAGHALFYSLRAFERTDWHDISRDAYGEEQDKHESFPRCGILTRYGAKDYYEGFAEWVAWSRSRLAKTWSDSFSVDLSDVDKSDGRYAESLQYLRDHGAVTKDEYDDLAPLFTDDEE